MIQAYQQTMMRTELERLREEVAEQRRLLQWVSQQALGAKTLVEKVKALDAITQHLKGKA